MLQQRQRGWEGGSAFGGSAGGQIIGLETDSGGGSGGEEETKATSRNSAWRTGWVVGPLLGGEPSLVLRKDGGA